MSEKFYDTEIAPTLKRLCEECQAKGISFLATVEYASGEVGRTEYLSESASWPQKLTHYAARAKGNLDALVIGIARIVGKNHGSIVLELMNTRAEPKEEHE